MARPPKYDWQALYEEYSSGGYETVTNFAEAKGIHPFAVQREFRRIKGLAHNKTKPIGTTKQNSETKQNKTKLAPFTVSFEKTISDFPQCQATSHKTGERCRRKALPGERFCRVHLDGWPGQCTAKSKQTGERCKKKAEPGKKVCRNHGGAPGSGAPPGSKNALKTGEYEAIWKDTLDEDEQDLYEQIETDPLAQIDDTIRLLSLRERRMMQRIQRLKDGLTEKQKRVLQERKTIKEAHHVYDEKTGSTKVVTVPRDELVVSEVEETEFRAIDDIIRLEEALTRVQEKKVKAIETKHKMMAKHGLDEERLRIEQERLELEKRKVEGGQGDISALDRFLEQVDAIASTEGDAGA